MEGLLQGVGKPRDQGRGISKQALNPYLEGREETRSSRRPGKNKRDHQEWAANSHSPQIIYCDVLNTKNIHTSIIANKGFEDHLAPQIR